MKLRRNSSHRNLGIWEEIWDNNTKTPQRIWMNIVANKIGQKVHNHRIEVVPNSQETQELLCSKD